MKITDVRVTPFKSETSKTVGFASITLEGVLVITGISIVKGANGLFISFPQRKDKDGEYRDIVFPITKEGRDVLTKKIVDAYNKALKKKKEDKDEAEELPFD